MFASVGAAAPLRRRGINLLLYGSQCGLEQAMVRGPARKASCSRALFVNTIPCESAFSTQASLCGYSCRRYNRVRELLLVLYSNISNKVSN